MEWYHICKMNLYTFVKWLTRELAVKDVIAKKNGNKQMLKLNHRPAKHLTNDSRMGREGYLRLGY